MKKKIFYEIMVFQILRKKYINSQLKKQGLYFGQHLILIYIKNHPKCSQKDLADYLKVTPASIAISTKRLEKNGFVIKEPCEENLRQNTLNLTEKGIHALKELDNFFYNLDMKALINITDEEYDLIEKTLDKMIFNYTGTSVDNIDIRSLLAENMEDDDNEKNS